MMKEACHYYFEKFSNKDIDKLFELFTDDVKLEDWNISVKGKEEVIKANKNIFNSVETIKVKPISLFEDGDTVCCEIIITVNDIEKIEVMDVITFDEQLKIKKIKAYKI